MCGFSQDIVSIRADSRFVPSQWEMALQSNAIFHWLGANLESPHSMYRWYNAVSLWHHQFSPKYSSWRHQMETFSALMTLCVGNSLVTVEFPTQRPVMLNFDVFFDLRLNKRLSKQSFGWWFAMPFHSLLRHCNAHYRHPIPCPHEWGMRVSFGKIMVWSRLYIIIICK